MIFLSKNTYKWLKYKENRYFICFLNVPILGVNLGGFSAKMGSNVLDLGKFGKSMMFKQRHPSWVSFLLPGIFLEVPFSTLSVGRKPFFSCEMWWSGGGRTKRLVLIPHGDGFGDGRQRTQKACNKGIR